MAIYKYVIFFVCYLFILNQYIIISIRYIWQTFHSASIHVCMNEVPLLLENAKFINFHCRTIVNMPWFNPPPPNHTWFQRLWNVCQLFSWFSLYISLHVQAMITVHTLHNMQYRECKQQWIATSSITIAHVSTRTCYGPLTRPAVLTAANDVYCVHSTGKWFPVRMW